MAQSNCSSSVQPSQAAEPSTSIPFNQQIQGITTARLNYYTENVTSAVALIEQLQGKCSNLNNTVLSLRDQVQERKWDATDAINAAKSTAAEQERRLDEAKQEILDEINASSVREREIRVEYEARIAELRQRVEMEKRMRIVAEKEVQSKDLELARKDEEITRKDEELDGTKKALAMAVQELEKLEETRTEQGEEVENEEIRQYQERIESIGTENEVLEGQVTAKRAAAREARQPRRS